MQQTRGQSVQGSELRALCEEPTRPPADGPGVGNAQGVGQGITQSVNQGIAQGGAQIEAPQQQQLAGGSQLRQAEEVFQPRQPVVESQPVVETQSAGEEPGRKLLEELKINETDEDSLSRGSVTRSTVTDKENSDDDDELQQEVITTRKATMRIDNLINIAFKPGKHWTSDIFDSDQLDLIKIEPEPKTMNADLRGIRFFRLTQSGQHVVVVDEQMVVRIYSYKNQILFVTYNHYQKQKVAITHLFPYESDKMLLAGEDKVVRIYDCQKLLVVEQFPVKQLLVYAMAFDVSKGQLAVGGMNTSKLQIFGKSTKRREIKFYDAERKFRFVSKIRLNNTQNVITHMDFTNDSAQSHFYTILGIVLQSRKPGDPRAQLVFIRFEHKKKPEIILDVSMLEINIQSVKHFFFNKKFNKFVCLENGATGKKSLDEAQNSFYTLSLTVKDDIIDCDQIQILDSGFIHFVQQTDDSAYLILGINQDQLSIFDPTSRKIISFTRKRDKTRFYDFAFGGDNLIIQSKESCGYFLQYQLIRQDN